MALRPAPKHYAVRVLLGFDLFCNALIGGNPYETLSSATYAYFLEGKRWAATAIIILEIFPFDKGHFERAYQRE